MTPMMTIWMTLMVGALLIEACTRVIVANRISTDLLDEFQSSPQLTGEPSTKTGDTGPSNDNSGPSLGSLDDDFARQLQLGMQDLLGEMQDSVWQALRPQMTGGWQTDNQLQKELQDQFEHLVKELNDATAAPGPIPSASSSSRPSDQAAANGKNSRRIQRSCHHYLGQPTQRGPVKDNFGD